MTSLNFNCVLDFEKCSLLVLEIRERETMNSLKSKYIVECIKYQKVFYSPIKKDGFIPESGSEIFVRNIPFRENEYDLILFFEKGGEIFQFRLMMDENGVENRGFAYVTYVNSTFARKALRELKETPYKGIYYFKIEQSLNNCRLFIGGIPTHKRKDQVWQELYKNGIKNIIDVIMYRSYSDRAENRGFVFVEFRTHEEAAYFRAKYGKTLRLWDSCVIVDWSVPMPQIDECIMEQVKILYLRNLNVIQSPAEFKKIVVQFTREENIEKLFKFKNYAFIHLQSRLQAEELMIHLKQYYKDTQVEVTWAKPPNKYTTQEFRQRRVSSLSLGLHSSFNSSRAFSTKSLSPIMFGKSPESTSQTIPDSGLPLINELKFKEMSLSPASTKDNYCQTTNTYLGPIMTTEISPSKMDRIRSLTHQGCNRGYSGTPPRLRHLFQQDERYLMSQTFCFCDCCSPNRSNAVSIPARYVPCPQSRSLPAFMSNPEGMYPVDFLQRQRSSSLSTDYTYMDAPYLSHIPMAPEMVIPVTNFFPSWERRTEPYDPIVQFQQRMSNLFGNNNKGERISSENLSDVASDNSLPRNYSIEELEEIIGDILD